MVDVYRQNSIPKILEIRLDSFTQNPGPRFKSDGEGSGEEFREIISRHLNNGTHVIVNLEGNATTTMFLEEVFGGLARTYGSKIVDMITIRCHSRYSRVEKAMKFMYMNIKWHNLLFNT